MHDFWLMLKMATGNSFSGKKKKSGEL